MNDLSLRTAIPPMSAEAIGKVRKLYEMSMEYPQIPIDTAHVIHGGMYSRTIMIPKNTMLTGALIKVPTVLIIQGDVVAYIGEETISLKGYNVLPASAGRKQAFVAQTDVYMTMIFSTNANTVEEAEREFTDEYELLMSRDMNNNVIITGE